MSMAEGLDWLSWAFILGGAFFALTGALGIIRLPCVFARMHAAGMVDTTGIGMILVGLLLQAEDWIVAVKLVLIVVFVFFTSPVATHALARAALHGGVKPKLAKDLKKKSKSAESKS